MNNEEGRCNVQAIKLYLVNEPTHGYLRWFKAAVSL
jgi:hypothetical protein